MKALVVVFGLFFAQVGFASNMILDCQNWQTKKSFTVFLSKTELSVLDGASSINLQNQSPIERSEPARHYLNFGTQRVGVVATGLLTNPSDIDSGTVQVYNNGKLEIDLNCKVSGFQD